MIKALMAVLFFTVGVFLIISYAPRKAVINTPPVSATGQSLPDNYEWDFGRVKEGVVLGHNFVFKNQTQKTIAIKQTSTSCGCTLSKVDKKVLPPGDSLVIGVQFNSKGYSGEVKQYVYVETDNLDNPIIKFIIKASVVK